MRWSVVVAASVVGVLVWMPRLARGSDHSQPITSGLSSEQRSERNWNNFWRHHTGTWNGRWTRYSADRSILETFKSTRQFESDDGLSTIQQTVLYKKKDGKNIEKKWTFNRKNHSGSKGFLHPASESMRGFALDDGAAVWLKPALALDAYSPFEFFLKQGNVRHSVGIVYDKQGVLERTASIREFRGDDQVSPWSDAIEQLDPWSIKGTWLGKRQDVNAMLDYSSTRPVNWSWPGQQHQLYYLPDKIILSCPDRIEVNQPFQIDVFWVDPGGNLQVLTANYSGSDNLPVISHLQLRQSDESVN